MNEENKVPVINADPEYGLTSAEASLRAEKGLANKPTVKTGRTEGQIIRENTCTFFNLVFVIMAVIIAMAIGTVIAAGISKSVKIINKGLEQVALGDFTQKFEIKRRDEFGSLGHVLNDTFEKIRLLMAEMKHFGGNVNQMADDISEKTEYLNESIQNISVGIAEVANGLQVQAAETDRSNDKMHEFADRLNAINVETNQMSGAIGEATEAVHQGQIIINDLHEKAKTTAEITDVLQDGQGVAKIDGYPLFVNNAVKL